MLYSDNHQLTLTVILLTESVHDKTVTSLPSLDAKDTHGLI